MMAATEKPKRDVDRERQWRKVDAGHYTSPKGRFQAARDAEGWTLIDIDGEEPPEFFTRWKDARAHVEAIEFPPVDQAPIVFQEDEIRDEFHDSYRVTMLRDGKRLGDVVVRNGRDVEPSIPGLPTMTLEEAQATATMLMLAVHNATRKEA